MTALNGVALSDVKKQVAEDFPQISVHDSCTKQLNNRYEVLVYLTIVDYIDLRMDENKHKKACALADGLTEWSCEQISYTDLLNKSKALILESAQKEKTKEKLVNKFYNPTISKKEAVKKFFHYIYDCFVAAFFL